MHFPRPQSRVWFRFLRCCLGRRVCHLQDRQRVCPAFFSSCHLLSDRAPPSPRETFHHFPRSDRAPPLCVIFLHFLDLTSLLGICCWGRSGPAISAAKLWRLACQVAKSSRRVSCLEACLSHAAHLPTHTPRTGRVDGAHNPRKHFPTARGRRAWWWRWWISTSRWRARCVSLCARARACAHVCLWSI